MIQPQEQQHESSSSSSICTPSSERVAIVVGGETIGVTTAATSTATTKLIPKKKQQSSIQKVKRRPGRPRKYPLKVLEPAAASSVLLSPFNGSIIEKESTSCIVNSVILNSTATKTTPTTMGKKPRGRPRKQKQQDISDNTTSNTNSNSRRGSRKNSNNNDCNNNTDAPRRSNRQKQKRKSNNNNTAKASIEDAKLRDAIEGDNTRTIIDIEADGNCLFRSISDQLYYDHGNKHQQVRQEICQYIQYNKDYFSVFLVLDDDNASDGDDGPDFESYIHTMQKDGEWGGHLELVAAARLYQRNVTVFSSNLDALHIKCNDDHNNDNNHNGSNNNNNKRKKLSSSPGPDMLLSYHDNDHYNSVRLNKNNKPPPPPCIKYYNNNKSSSYNYEEEQEEVYKQQHRSESISVSAEDSISTPSDNTININNNNNNTITGNCNNDNNNTINDKPTTQIIQQQPQSSSQPMEVDDNTTTTQSAMLPSSATTIMKTTTKIANLLVSTTSNKKIITTPTVADFGTNLVNNTSQFQSSSAETPTISNPEETLPKPTQPMELDDNTLSAMPSSSTTAVTMIPNSVPCTNATTNVEVTNSTASGGATSENSSRLMSAVQTSSNSQDTLLQSTAARGNTAIIQPQQTLLSHPPISQPMEIDGRVLSGTSSATATAAAANSVPSTKTSIITNTESTNAYVADKTSSETLSNLQETRGNDESKIIQSGRILPPSQLPIHPMELDYSTLQDNATQLTTATTTNASNSSIPSIKTTATIRADSITPIVSDGGGEKSESTNHQIVVSSLETLSKAVEAISMPVVQQAMSNPIVSHNNQKYNDSTTALTTTTTSSSLSPQVPPTRPKTNNKNASSNKTKNNNNRITKNSYCPCGSALRYKKCCLPREKAAKKAAAINKKKPNASDRDNNNDNYDTNNDNNNNNLQNNDPSFTGDFRVLHI